MSGRDQEGFKWIDPGSSAAQLELLFNELGWSFFPSNQQTGYSIVTGRWGGQALRINEINAEPTAIKPLLAATGAGTLAEGFLAGGFYYYADNSGQWVFGFYDAVDQKWQVCVEFRVFGVVVVWLGDPRAGGSILGVSPAGSFNDQVWNDFEIYAKIDAVAGEVEVRLQTKTVIHLTGVNTKNSSHSYFDSWGYEWTFAFGQTAIDAAITDLRVYDTSGSINNTWLGTRKVLGLLPASDGATLNFTRSNAGLASWQNIKNQTVDDSLYLFDGTVSDFNLSGFQAMPANDDVAWLGLSLFQRQDDATQITSKIRISSSGTTADGGSYFPTQTYSADQQIFELDPHTSTQFSGTTVNALTGGPLIFAIA